MRDVEISVDSQNKRTHSYTAQPMISRDGRLFGKLLLCLQETTGVFGPKVGPGIRKLEEDYGNIRVFASKSGKMSSNLMRDWINDVLLPAPSNRLRSVDIDAEIGSESNVYDPDDDDDVFDEGVNQQEPEQERLSSRPPFIDAEQREDPRLRSLARLHCRRRSHSLLLVDSWGGHSSDTMMEELQALGIEPLLIPKHTTGEIQPPDVVFMRQYKKFIKRIVEEAIHTNQSRMLERRETIINMHSLVWNQFDAEAYTDMLRYAWRHTNPAYGVDELALRPVPPMVQELQFNFDASQRCQVPICTAHAFIKCAHCGKLICLQHFLERTCFHDENDGPRAGTSADSANVPIVTRSVRRSTLPEYSDWEHTFYENLANLRQTGNAPTEESPILEIGDVGGYDTDEFESLVFGRNNTHCDIYSSTQATNRHEHDELKA